MKLKIIYIGISTILLNFSMVAQVGTMENTPNKDAILDLNNTNSSNTKGLLLPKIALTALNNPFPLTTHVSGIKIYNTTTAGSGTTKVTPGEYYNDGNKWVRISTSAWQPIGNNGTTATGNSIGTADTADFATRTNNTEQMRITGAGNVLIGTTSTPTGGSNTKLSITNTTAGAIQIKDGTEGNGKFLVSDANGNATWQTVDLGERAVSIDLCSVMNIPTSLTVFSNYPAYTNYQLVPGTSLTVTIPSGYTSSKTLLHWDFWGDLGLSPSLPNQGSLRYYIYQTGTSTNLIKSISMSQWTVLNNITKGTCAPISYIIENLAPGTYTFQLGVSREDETANIGYVQFWGVQGKGEVYVK